MQKIRFYLLDAGYNTFDNKATILLFGRTIEGKKIVLQDQNFKPYFYSGADESIKDIISKIFVENGKFFVTHIETVKKKLIENEKYFFKIFVNLPSAVPAIKNEIRHTHKDLEMYEYDIPFAQRYLRDKKITPMKLTEAEIDDKQNILAIKTIEETTFTVRAEYDSAGHRKGEPKILAIDIETYFEQADKRIIPEQNPILMIALYGKDFKKVLTWKEFPAKNGTIEFLKTEAEMIIKACESIREYTPDILTGYFSDGFDLPYLKIRAEKNGVPLVFSADGATLKISGKTTTIAEIKGIIHIDIFKFIRRVISRSMKTDVFTLDAVSAELLGDHKHEVDLNQLSEAWNKSSEELEKFCNYNLHDAKLTYDLCAKVLPTIIEFTILTGGLLFDVNRMTFSQLVEAYILNNAHDANEIAPNKPTYKQKQERMLMHIKGAFVFEPKPGIYDNIIVFDYRSLYPSVIASHNISPGTLNCECCKQKQKKLLPEQGELWFCENKKGFLSQIIEHLINVRATVKAQIKKGKNDQMTLARSEALKVLANSFYGYLGFYGARWYCKECAEATTAFGRQYIHQVIDAAQSEGFSVIYGDTDSVFLMLDKKTKDNALEFVEKINRELPGVMELEFEGMYPAGIFVSAKAGEAGAKKKYALLDEKGIMKIKGFETVRRNWSFIAKDVQKKVLEIVLKEKNPAKAANYLRETINALRKKEIPITKLVIHTQLRREVSTYKNVSPHVAAAQRMQTKGIEVSSGTMIKFVIVQGKGKIRDKVRLPDEAKQEEYDAEYYVNNQILPSVEKIFAVLGYAKEDILLEKTQSSIEEYV